jgi:branched-chain amino acid transport system ATP-binding protein
MLELTSISSFYGDSQVLFDVDLNVKEGTVVSVIGRNGAGKTTVLRSIMNLAEVHSGSINYRGEDITGVDTTEVGERGIGYVPEDRQIFNSLTVEENLRIATTNVTDRESHIRMAYDYFPDLKELSTTRGQHLSGGQQQMLAIARGLIGNNNLLLIDEPNEGLAPSIAADVNDSIMNLKGESTILLISQSIDLVFEISDRIFAMEDGMIVFSGTPSEFKAQDVADEVLTVG